MLISVYVLISFCFIGYSKAHGPKETIGLQYEDVRNIVKSALTFAIHEQDEQDQLDAFLLEMGYDVDKSNGQMASMSSMSQLTDILAYMKNSTVQQCRQAFISVYSTKYISQHLSMSPHEMVNDQKIVQSWHKLYSQFCASRTPSCLEETLVYRTIDGSCNNRLNPTWGMASRPQKRYLPPQYGDGVNSPRTMGVNGYPLPSPRAVSNLIHQTVVNDLVDNQDTVMVMQFGQVVDHDLIDTPMLTGRNRATLECCDLPTKYAEERAKCFPIRIPPKDNRFKFTCMNFARSGFGTSDDCSLGKREQLNELTSYMDSTFLYGADTTNEQRIREYFGGRLLMTKDGFFTEHENPNNCIREIKGHYCMKSGDRRMHITPIMATSIIMFLRQHNMIADGLAVLNPHWSDEQLYQTTRKIIIALTQHITYTEYLPSILDPITMKTYGLIGPPLGFDHVYDPTVDSTIANSFGVAAFRFGHSQIPNFVQLVNKFHKSLAANLSETFNRPTLVFRKNGYTDLNRFLSYGLGSKTDRFLENSVREDLLLDDMGMAFDLASLNIQRGRDHAIPGYNAYRKLLNLPVAHRFIHGPGGFVDINPKVVAMLSTLYEDPADVDLWTGGLSENPIPGGSVGPTFAGLLAQQFREIKVGDRFWYENPFQESGFTIDQLNSIKHFTLAKMMCNTNDIEYVQENVFKIPGKGNEVVPCATIPDIDLAFWKDLRGPGSHLKYA